MKIRFDIVFITNLFIILFLLTGCWLQQKVDNKTNNLQNSELVNDSQVLTEKDKARMYCLNQGGIMRVEEINGENVEICLINNGEVELKCELELFYKKVCGYAEVNNFKECAHAGYPIMESEPRQCRTPSGVTYIEEL